MSQRTFIVSAVMALAAVAAVAQAPVRVGEYVHETFQTPHPYSAIGRPASSHTIHFPGATYIAPHFERFQLGEGDHVVVRSPDGEQSWTYEGLGKLGLGLTKEGFFSGRIRGDTAVIELFTSGQLRDAWGYRIDYFGRGYSGQEIAEMWADGLGPALNLPRPAGAGESICVTDDKENAICYDTSEAEIYQRSRAVARLFINGSFTCTGWLVGDEGHVMTNEHCITSNTTAMNTEYEWMAEAAGCPDFCGQLGCDGVIEATAGTLIQDNVGLDYALVLPDTTTGTGTDLPATYGFMRLRPEGVVLDERIYIPQHPGGRGKEIAVFSTYPADVTGFAAASSMSEPICDSQSPTLEVGYWADTEGGSSGSPVLGYSDHTVVALHHCRGSGFCNAGSDPPDDRNRGLPIQAIIADLGANLPDNAVGGPIFEDGFESGDTSAW